MKFQLVTEYYFQADHSINALRNKEPITTAIGFFKINEISDSTGENPAVLLSLLNKHTPKGEGFWPRWTWQIEGRCLQSWFVTATTYVHPEDAGVSPQTLFEKDFQTRASRFFASISE